jgi:hypothetical protein
MLTRRSFLAGAALAAPTAALAVPILDPFGRNAINPFAAPQGSVAPLLATTGEDPSFDAYLPTLGSNGYTPATITWNGQPYKCDMGSTWNLNMPHSCRVTSDKVRFELHNTLQDRAVNDPSDKRRTEFHYKKFVLSNGIEYWGAYSFLDHSWADPLGMKAKTSGGAHFQMHMPSGGSPAFAFRRYKDGSFGITTNPGGNVKRLTLPLSFNGVHDLVYRCVCHPTTGQLDVWVDGKQILSYRGPMGVSSNGYYACHGLYYAGGVTCNVVAEFANVVEPRTANLLGRVGVVPVWPAA